MPRAACHCRTQRNANRGSEPKCRAPPHLELNRHRQHQRAHALASHRSPRSRCFCCSSASAAGLQCTANTEPVTTLAARPAAPRIRSHTTALTAQLRSRLQHANSFASVIRSAAADSPVRFATPRRNSLCGTALGLLRFLAVPVGSIARAAVAGRWLIRAEHRLGAVRRPIALEDALRKLRRPALRGCNAADEDGHKQRAEADGQRIRPRHRPRIPPDLQAASVLNNADLNARASPCKAAQPRRDGN